jgi:threonine/homoserine/homoserine lactone efflux protein
MTPEVWLAYVVACTVLLLVPGPTITTVVSYALGEGRASGFATVPGTVVGDFTAMTLSLLGAGAILAASATLFTVLKLFGAAYLIWMGIQLWRSNPEAQGVSDMKRDATARRMFWNCYVVTALNPKSIVFFIAFVPQFVNPAAAALPQFVILETTFLILAGISVPAVLPYSRAPWSIACLLPT